MSIEEEFQKCDLDSIVDRMTLYVYGRIKLMGIKSLEGKEPFDFVAEVLLKVVEGKRDWGKAECSFELFLFGCLKSDLYRFFKKPKPKYAAELLDIPDNEEFNSNLENREEVILLLRQEGSDDDEIVVFECWMDGLLKPKEIANDLGIEIKQVNNISKRILRRLSKIHTIIQDLK